MLNESRIDILQLSVISVGSSQVRLVLVFWCIDARQNYIYLVLVYNTIIFQKSHHTLKLGHPCWINHLQYIWSYIMMTKFEYGYVNCSDTFVVVVAATNHWKKSLLHKYMIDLLSHTSSYNLLSSVPRISKKYT